MQNRPVGVVLAALLLLAVPAAAQERPAPYPETARVEVFVGYGEQTSLGGSGHPVLAPSRLRVGVDWNVTDRVALVFGAPRLGVGHTATGTSVDYSLLAGPRLRFRAQQRVMPFVQLLFGVEHSAVVGNSALSESPFGSPDRRTAFQSAVGGGVDIRFGRRYTWRALQIEERSQFRGPDNDHQLSVASGIVIAFGARK